MAGGDGAAVGGFVLTAIAKLGREVEGDGVGRSVGAVVGSSDGCGGVGIAVGVEDGCTVVGNG